MLTRCKNRKDHDVVWAACQTTVGGLQPDKMAILITMLSVCDAAQPVDHKFDALTTHYTANPPCKYIHCKQSSMTFINVFIQEDRTSKFDAKNVRMFLMQLNTTSHKFLV